jgi:hypothetical protein
MHRYAHALTLLLLASCLGARDQALFDDAADLSVAGTGVMSASGANTGTGSGSGSAAQGSGGSVALGASGGTGAAGGSGAAGSGSLATAGAGGPRGGAPAIEVPVVTDCAMVESASVGDNGHCYRVNETELTFNAASAACQAAGGHLVTIGDEAENELAAALHDGEHWIGASDGLADTAPGVGTYTWVVAEPFDYSDWEQDQPNAYETDCPDQDDEADCFEHCAFQTDEGDWNDRSCWHAIASICEWDVEGPTSAGGAGGAPSAEPAP